MITSIIGQFLVGRIDQSLRAIQDRETYYYRDPE